ncbi:MAG: glutamine amidotransferase [Planctomycetaceae bacterium]
MSVHFEPVWSWTLTLIVCVAMLAVVWLGYPRRIRHVATPWRRMLIALRLAIVVVLCLLLLRPLVVFESQDQSDSILYVLTDASRSMQTEDIPGGGTRRQALLKVLKAAEPGLTAIGKKTEIRFRDFSDAIQSVQIPGEAAEGTMTANGRVLELLSEEMGKDRVLAVSFLGDGRQAASGALDVDPTQAARLYGKQQRPIYSVGFGSTEASAASLDLALDELDLSREVFQGNVLPIRVKLRASGAQGQPVRIRVLLENRTGKHDGESGEMVPVPVTEETRPIAMHTPQTALDETLIQLQIAPEQFGDLKLAVEAEPLPGEVRKTNNRVETIIRVRRGGIRVAYFDIVRPEQKWVKQINDSSRIQLDYQWIRSGAFRDRNKIPERFFVPGNYDAFIIGDVPADAFTAQQIQEIAICCNRGAGLMMTGGRENFGKGGYGKSILAPLFPIELPPENQQLTEPQKMLPSRDGLSHYVMQIAAPDQNRSRWNQLPPLSGANLLVPRQASLAQVLAVSDSGHPLLIGQTVGAARVLVFAGDTTWQNWYMQGYPEEHTRFWRQTIFWLTRKETDDEQPVWVLANPRDLTPGQPTELSFGARDTEGRPVADATFELSVTDPKGQSIPLTPRSGIGMSLSDFSQTADAGDYWVRVKASKDGEPIAGIATTRFHVNARDPELDDPSSDFSLLREISHSSGGEFLTPDAFVERIKQWANDGLPGIALTRQERMSLWDNWPVLLLLVLLMTSEWAIRKKRGLV